LSACDLGPDSVAGSELSGDAVGAAEVVNDSLTDSDLGPTSVTGSELADGSVGSGEVADGSLTGDDIAIESGNVANYDAPNVPAATCILDGIDTSTAADMTDAAILVTADAPETVSISGVDSNTAGFIRVVICNPSAGAVNPAPMTLHFVAFGAVN
jgi:hypothetical protein